LKCNILHKYALIPDQLRQRIFSRHGQSNLMDNHKVMCKQPERKFGRHKTVRSKPVLQQSLLQNLWMLTWTNLSQQANTWDEFSTLDCRHGHAGLCHANKQPHTKEKNTAQTTLRFFTIQCRRKLFCLTRTFQTCW